MLRIVIWDPDCDFDRLHEIPSVDAERVFPAGTVWYFKHDFDKAVVKQESDATAAEICAALASTGNDRLATFPPPFAPGIAVHDGFKEQFPSRMTMDVQLALTRDILRIAPKWRGSEFKVAIIATSTKINTDNMHELPIPEFQTVLGGCDTSLAGCALWFGGCPNCSGT